jgi:hypothetical protein
LRKIWRIFLTPLHLPFTPPAHIAILASAGKLRPLGRPNPNAVKFFSAVELIALLADRE